MLSKRDNYVVYTADNMRWRAAHSSKVKGEAFMLYYTPVWIGIMAVIVLGKWYERFSPNDYLLTGLCLSLPCILVPLVLARNDPTEKHTPIFNRYIIKANIFIAIISYLGNHFYTHYFYKVLGMRYTGPLAEGKGWDINHVPASMYAMTHVYFMSYHVLVTPVLRATNSLFTSRNLKFTSLVVIVCVVAFLTAFAETLTISGFPYYTYPDFHQMLTKGSMFYGTFFVVTFPWFYRMDEDPTDLWPVGRVAMEALAAMMVVLLCADIWRLLIERFGSLPIDVPYA